MRRVLIALSPILLGLSGSILGLLTIGSFLATSPSQLTSCSCGLASAVETVQLPIITGSLLGMCGSLAYAKNVYAGGILLLVGGLIALAPLLLLDIFGLPI